MRLSKAGYGRVDEILAMPCDLVLTMIEYEQFAAEYEGELIALNREPRS